MSIKRILALGLIIGALLCSAAHADPDSNTANPIDSLNPASGTYGSTAYPGQLFNFLAKEDANRAAEYKFVNFVNSGCLGATSPGLVMTPSACIAYNAGFRGTETGSITFTSGASFWVAMDENTSGSNAGLPNFTRAGSTHYLIDSIDVSQPTMPADAQLLMRVTTLAGAITVVTDLRVLTPQVAGPAGPPGATGPAGATGATGPAGPAPAGVVPQLVGYSAPNTVEAETVTGDCTFTRGGANAYTISCTKVNGNAVSSTAPTNSQIWVENAGATSMVPVSITGDCTIAATGAITCTKLNGVSPSTCTNQFLTAIGTCTTDTLASAQHANQGTTTTVLHGNAAGNPSFGAVALTTDVTGTLPIGNGGTGVTTGAVVTITTQQFTASGTYTPHAGLLYAFVRVVGSGGAGGSGNGNSAGQDSGASGGCSGGYSEAVVTAAQITTDGGTETVTVGNGGTPGAAGNNPGGNGSDVSFGSRVIGKGGGGGGGANGSATVPAACTPAVAGTGAFTPVGNAGGLGISAGITTVNLASGFGAPSVFGGGAVGVNDAAAGCVAGNAGGNYGAGGSGAVCIATTNTAQGGAGQKGVVLVTEYNSQ